MFLSEESFSCHLYSRTDFRLLIYGIKGKIQGIGKEKNPRKSNYFPQSPTNV